MDMLHDFSKDAFDIFIQAGQSNSVGGGKGLTPYRFLEDWGEQKEIWYLNPDFTISTAGERVWGNQPIGDFSLSFARKYIQSGLLKPGRKILIVRGGEGGTGFSDGRWNPGDDLRVRLRDLVLTAKNLNDENRLMCFLWHQGETDAMAEADGETHYNNLLRLVEEVRALAEDQQLPFVTAGFVPEWEAENLGSTKEVAQAIRRVCDSAGCARFVEAQGLRSNFQAGADDCDHIHFCRDSLYELGERMFQAYTELSGGAETSR